jgi:hypothetical protein
MFDLKHFPQNKITSHNLAKFILKNKHFMYALDICCNKNTAVLDELPKEK